MWWYFFLICKEYPITCREKNVLFSHYWMMDIGRASPHLLSSWETFLAKCTFPWKINSLFLVNKPLHVAERLWSLSHSYYYVTSCFKGIKTVEAVHKKRKVERKGLAAAREVQKAHIYKMNKVEAERSIDWRSSGTTSSLARKRESNTKVTLPISHISLD